MSELGVKGVLEVVGKIGRDLGESRQALVLSHTLMVKWLVGLQEIALECAEIRRTIERMVEEAGDVSPESRNEWIADMYRQGGLTERLQTLIGCVVVKEGSGFPSVSGFSSKSMRKILEGVKAVDVSNIIPDIPIKGIYENLQELNEAQKGVSGVMGGDTAAADLTSSLSNMKHILGEVFDSTVGAKDRVMGVDLSKFTNMHDILRNLGAFCSIYFKPSIFTRGSFLRKLGEKYAQASESLGELGISFSPQLEAQLGEIIPIEKRPASKPQAEIAGKGSGSVEDLSAVQGSGRSLAASLPCTARGKTLGRRSLGDGPSHE